MPRNDTTTCNMSASLLSDPSFAPPPLLQRNPLLYPYRPLFTQGNLELVRQHRLHSKMPTSPIKEGFRRRTTRRCETSGSRCIVPISDSCHEKCNLEDDLPLLIVEVTNKNALIVNSIHACTHDAQSSTTTRVVVSTK